MIIINNLVIDPIINQKDADLWTVASREIRQHDDDDDNHDDDHDDNQDDHDYTTHLQTLNRDGDFWTITLKEIHHHPQFVCWWNENQFNCITV